MQSILFSDKRLKGRNYGTVEEGKAPIQIAVNAIVSPRLSFAQRYKKSEASIHVHAVRFAHGNRNPEQFCAVIQYGGIDYPREEGGIHIPGQHNFIAERSPDCRVDHLMLVSVRQLVNDPKGVDVCLISEVVRLQSLNECQHRWGYAPRKSIRVYSVAVTNVLNENGECELGSPNVRGERESEQLPQKVIQGGPHILETIPNDCPQIWRRLFPDIQDETDKFAVYLFDNLRMVAVKILSDFLIQQPQMFFCPDEFEPNAIK